MILNRTMIMYVTAATLAVASGALAQVALDGMHVSVPPEQKLESPPDDQAIIRELLKVNNHQATPKGFKAEVGADIPRDMHLSAFPPKLIEQIPALKNLMYAHLDRNIVIIDALYLKAEAIIPLPDSLRATENAPSVAVAALNRIGGLAHVAPATKHAIFSRLSGTSSETTGAATSIGNARQPVPQGTAILAGAGVPESISLTAVPEEVSSLLQQSPLSYSLLQDGRLLIAEPNSRQVVGLILRDEGAPAKDPSGTRDPLKQLENSGGASAYTSPNEKR
jgi:hypothetical protein